MRRLFADTFYWVALTNPEDSFNREVFEYNDYLAGAVLVTTEEVLTEYLTFFARNSRLRHRAVVTVRAILEDPAVQIVPQSHGSFLAGLELYAARLDKGYSLADCISMQTMRREGLFEVLTKDHHFQQEGFRPLFSNARRGGHSTEGD